MAMTEGGKFDGGHTYRDSGDKNQLSYLDLIERSTNEEEKRQRERLIADEGIQLWKSKRNTEIEQIEKDKQTVRKTTKMYHFSEEEEKIMRVHFATKISPIDPPW